MKYFLPFLLLFVVPLFGWFYQRDLGGGLDDGRDVAICADGGTFIVGRSNAWAEHGYVLNWFDHEMFLIKLNEMGEEQWIRH
jgi:hypothetical protein